MRTNALLIRWSDGWRRRVDSGEIAANTRVEALLSIEHVTHDDEVDRQADKELERFAAGQKQITTKLAPTGSGDVPFTDWFLGDRMPIDGATRRAVSIAFGRSKEQPGELDYDIGWGDRIETPEKRMHRQLKKMSNGAGGGSFRTASPPARHDRARAHPTLESDWHVEFPQKGTIADATSYAWSPHKETTVVGMVLTFDDGVTSSADADVTLVVNGVDQETLTLPTGDESTTLALVTPITVSPVTHKVKVRVAGNGGDGVGFDTLLICNDSAGGSAPA